MDKKHICYNCIKRNICRVTEKTPDGQNTFIGIEQCRHWEYPIGDHGKGTCKLDDGDCRYYDSFHWSDCPRRIARTLVVKKVLVAEPFELPPDYKWEEIAQNETSAKEGCK